MKKLTPILVACACLGFVSAAHATPSTTVWAPSVASCQGFMVPHLTYDTYFGKAPGAAYPVITGLTMGVLPFEKLQLELGFDAFLPAPDPLYLNAKLGTPESSLFEGSPGVGVGIFGVGTRSKSAAKDSNPQTNYNILYGQVQKTLPWGGYVSAGGYYGMSRELFNSSSGDNQRTGFIGAITAPDIVIDATWLKKISLMADVQTGKNAFGAAGLASSFYFTDTIAVLTGPIYFFDKDLQPGGKNVMWTVQLDIDMPLLSKPATAAPLSPEPQPAKAPQPASNPPSGQVDNAASKVSPNEPANH